MQVKRYTSLLMLCSVCRIQTVETYWLIPGTGIQSLGELCANCLRELISKASEALTS